MPTISNDIQTPKKPHKLYKKRESQTKSNFPEFAESVGFEPNIFSRKT